MGVRLGIITNVSDKGVKSNFLERLKHSLFYRKVTYLPLTEPYGYVNFVAPSEETYLDSHDDDSKKSKGKLSDLINPKVVPSLVTPSRAKPNREIAREVDAPKEKYDFSFMAEDVLIEPLKSVKAEVTPIESFDLDALFREEEQARPRNRKGKGQFSMKGLFPGEEGL
ncbi:MAG: hypothetical protein ACI9BD_001135 [Candidatus Marinamargulisbacteria bacterium]